MCTYLLPYLLADLFTYLPHLNQQYKAFTPQAVSYYSLSLYLQRDGQAELTLVSGHIVKWFTYPSSKYTARSRTHSLLVTSPTTTKLPSQFLVQKPGKPEYVTYNSLMSAVTTAFSYELPMLC